MNIQIIAPELRPVYRYLPPVPYHLPAFRLLANALIRSGRRSKLSGGVRIEERKIGGWRMRIYQPPGDPSGAGLLWIHGGGYLVGSPGMDDRFCSKAARDLNLAVFSVGYRLAPEYPYPAAIDDCFQAWEWLISAAGERGVDPARIVLGGQSAGGGLAACLAQRILDGGGTQPAGQLLIFPMLDDRTAADRSLDAALHPLWNNQNNLVGWKAYLGQEPGLGSTPAYAAASRREDLAGLPPAWIGVGDIDLFYQENKAYASRLAAAGVPCALQIIEGAPHGFNAVAPGAEITRGFNDSIWSFLRNCLAI